MNALQSYIYAIKAVGTNRYKIGMTTDLKGRLATVQTGCPYPAQIVATWEGDRRLETAIHRELADVRKVGEWFEVELEEIERAVEAVRAAGLVYDVTGKAKPSRKPFQFRRHIADDSPAVSGMEVNAFAGWNLVKGKPPRPDGWETVNKGIVKIGRKVVQGIYYHWIVRCSACNVRIERKVGRHFSPRAVAMLLEHSEYVQIKLVKLRLHRKAREIARHRLCTACGASQGREVVKLLPVPKETRCSQ